VLRKLRDVQNYEDYFRDEGHVRTAIAAYYGMVSFLDDNIGGILNTLHETGLDDETLVVYSSDHGDNLGTRTFWGKSNMYEESVGVPLILNGPGIPVGRRIATPVSLIDAYPTIVEAVGEPSTAADQALPGTSLLRLLDGKNTDRTVFSEYHAVGSLTGIFMVRFGRYKYVHYEGYRPQLFDVAADPMETRDLALASGYDAALGLRRSGAADPRTRRYGGRSKARKLSVHTGARRGAALFLIGPQIR
jgi:choline-sulfatase